MFNHKLICPLIALILWFTSLNGQGKKPLSHLQLMNGKLLEVSLGDTSGANVFYSIQKKNGKWLDKSLYKDRIFSIINENGEESVLYSTNLLIGDDYSVQEMRYFIYGESDATNGYNAKPTFYGGLAIGAAGGYGFQGGIIYPFMIPLGYTLTMQIPFIKIRQETITDHQNTYHETYKIGYEKTARTRKTINALLGSLLGAAIGSSLYEITH
ncbi:MAG: hypothetical protein HKN39_05250 [Flavobacteriales bacterium]|nr:hypothetical protein [Flavobacteriales bacterium]